MFLSSLKKGQKAVIETLSGEAEDVKLLEMGCLPGTEIILKFRAPFGGPLAIKVGSYTLSLRASEAQKIRIKPV